MAEKEAQKEEMLVLLIFLVFGLPFAFCLLFALVEVAKGFAVQELMKHERELAGYDLEMRAEQMATLRFKPKEE